MATEKQPEGRNEGGQKRTTSTSTEPGAMPWMSSPFSMMRRFAEEMDRAFGSIGRSAADWQPGPGTRGEWSPQVEMFEREGNIIVHADLPGLKKEDVTIEVRNNNLILEGERKETRKEEKKGYYHSERAYGRFYRRIPLPEEIDINQISATFSDGVLEVKMPSPEHPDSRGGRRIEIQ